LTARYYLAPPLHLEDDALARRIESLGGIKQAGGQKLIHYDEVQKHTTSDDCWVIIEVSELNRYEMSSADTTSQGQGV